MQQYQNDPVYDLTSRSVPAWWKVLKFVWRVAVYLFLIVAFVGLIGSIAAIVHLFGGINNLP